MRLAAEEAWFYASQSAASDPGEMAGLYEGLPREVGELARMVRDLMIHRLEGGLWDVPIADDWMRDDAETRYMDDILRLITARDARPLASRRPYGDRFVATCRDFTLLHVSLLRHLGIPARLRSGFATYFGADDVPFDTARRLFAANDSLRTPPTVLSYAPFNGPSYVTLR